MNEEGKRARVMEDGGAGREGKTCVIKRVRLEVGKKRALGT